MPTHSVLRIICLMLLALASPLHAADSTILVMGATGRQGTALVDQLLIRGYAVRGMTRKPDGKKALALAERGIEMVQGDYGDPESLQAALSGVDSAFFYSGFSRNELQEGLNVIAAARAADVAHLVYSSGAAAEPGAGMAGTAKMQIEQALVASKLPYTVLRPVAFMENFRGQQARTYAEGVIDSRAPDRKVFFIAVEDIGFFAAEAIANPSDWIGRAVNISADEMTLAELAKTFSDVMDADITYTRMPLEAYLERFPNPMQPLFRWYDEVGYSVDTARWRATYPELMTLQQYLRATGWEGWRPPAD